MKRPQKLLWLFVLALVLAPALFAHAQDQNQSYYTDDALMRIAGNKYDAGELPLGDNHYVLDRPRKGYIYLCHKFGNGEGGAQHAGSWIHGESWNIREKPSVQGKVNWPNAAFTDTLDGNQRELEGNGLPIDHPTGIFPIQRSDPASAFDRNPNSIQPQSVHEILPADPYYTDPPYCMGMEVGYMLSGVPLFNGFDAGLRDAAAHEVQDGCQGHPQKDGVYHYHSLSSCIRDISIKKVIGYALDGFPITGPLVADGKYLTTDNLDVCHGITSEIIQDGEPKTTYHYVMTVDFPYSVSCFRAKPVRTGPAQGLPHRPPEDAIDACNGRNEGDVCAFTSPRGDTINGNCRVPPGNPLACVPASR